MATAAAALTLAVALTPSHGVADPAPTVRLVLETVMAVTALFAAALFLRGRARGWVAPALVVLAIADIAAVAAPGPIAIALPVHLLATAVRLLSHAALLLAALQFFADSAVRSERRRIARDIHDGVTQELAYIERRAPRLADSALGREITAAAERAQVESRQAIERLAGPPTQPLEAVAERCGVALELRGQPLQPELERIAAEAIRNAARHGRARLVRVHATSARLRISDDGIGFDPKHTSRGFGLIGMRERAEALGGALRVHSRPGQGTEIEVELP